MKTSSRHAPTAPASCLNCSLPLPSGTRFCPRCGQENHDLKVPLRHLLGELFETVLHFDGKTLRTLKNLAGHPGSLSAEFASGRRISQVPPLRLYLSISVLFFLLLTMQIGHVEQGEAGGAKPGMVISYHGLSSNDLRGLDQQSIDRLALEKGLEPTPFNRHMVRQMTRFANGDKAGFVHSLIRAFSYALFLLMPLFALWLHLGFHRRRPYYVFQLVFAIHLHAFTFLALSLALLPGLLRWEDGTLVALLILMVWLPAYLFRALRRMYGVRALPALGLTLGLTLIHSLVTLIVIGVAFFSTLMVF